MLMYDSLFHVETTTPTVIIGAGDKENRNGESGNGDLEIDSRMIGMSI